MPIHHRNVLFLLACLGYTFVTGCSENSGTSGADAAAAQPQHHGWVLASHQGISGSDTDQELWDSPADMCNGFRIVAQRMVDAQQNGDDPGSVSSTVPGQHEVPAGTWVDIAGHSTYTCPDTTTIFNFTQVRIRDGGSDLDNQVLYIQEGNLSKE